MNVREAGSIKWKKTRDRFTPGLGVELSHVPAEQLRVKKEGH